MAKRFVDTEKNRVAHRGMDPKLRLAYEWTWQNCDQAGVWKVDLALFKFECGYTLNVEGLLKACQTLRKLPNGALFHTDFVQVNYGELKPGYNPHKPVFRSLQANGIDPLTLQFSRVDQDLNNPSARVEEEGEGEEEGERKEGVQGKPPADQRFEGLWVTFERYGSKAKALEYWNQNTEADRDVIIEKAQAYVLSTPGCQYRKQLEGWINPKNRLWERPIPKPVTPVPVSNRSGIPSPMGRNQPIELDLRPGTTNLHKG